MGNVRAVIDRDKSGDDAVVSSRYDYYPWGMPAYRSYAKHDEGREMPDRQLTGTPAYRHGYQGEFTEKDEETGWDAFELRMWDARLARWMSTDPYRQYHSPYVGMGNDPVNMGDPDGGFSGNKNYNSSNGLYGTGGGSGSIILSILQFGYAVYTGIKSHQSANLGNNNINKPLDGQQGGGYQHAQGEVLLIMRMIFTILCLKKQIQNLWKCSQLRS